MTTRNATVYMTLLAFSPPATTLACHLAGINVISGTSLATKTICLVAYAFIQYSLVLPYFTSPLRHLPTPQTDRFIWGHGEIMLDRPPGAKLLRWMKEIPNDGLITFRTFFHIGPIVLLTRPDTLMQVLNTHSYDYEKPAPARKFLRRVLGDGLINVEGNEHKRQRKTITPAFTGRHIKDLVPLFWSKSLMLGDAVVKTAASNGGIIEVSALASRVTLDIIGAAGIGKDFSTTENADHELAQKYDIITDTKGKGNLVLYFAVNLVFPQWLIRKLPLKANARVANALFDLRRISKDLLAEKNRDMEEKTVQEKDIIAILMRSGVFNDDGLTDQLLTFLAAGHETTASALTWATYLLGRHQAVQARLRTEVHQTIPALDPNTPATADLIDSMPYLDAVCNEVLRIYPTVPVTARIAVRPTQINNTPIPTGTSVMISPWATNRLPSLWGEDAEVFRPERWLGEEGKWGGATSGYAFVTFLHGPRSCIGQGFARYELKCMLAVLVARVRWELRERDVEPMPEGTLTIKPKGGMEIVVEEL
ncbi:cytochrome P450 [Pseudovirgaria hyperparasitica]|uniref:Cytochrome P450 n=1 Tax=Pseudovirgaria hyperparasitica TaxID=470096 RepID=A0A6A6W7X5_9PEZI|nr:cytochrome P450 [Pseudovirgaria hyperparasitica]KAF2757986.1 cytochrome P450 [Pseudovirgaria hyperparasitica]